MDTRNMDTVLLKAPLSQLNSDVAEFNEHMLQTLLNDKKIIITEENLKNLALICDQDTCSHLVLQIEALYLSTATPIDITIKPPTHE